MSALTATAVRPDAAEVAKAAINRVLPTYRDGLHATTSEALQHEADRLEAVPPSLISDAMRASVDAERTWRRHLERLGAHS